MTNGLAEALLKLRNRHILLIDVLFFSVTPALALALRTDSWQSIHVHWPSLLVVTPVLMAVKLAVYIPAGLYNRLWRYASVDELAKIVLAGLIAIMIQFLVLVLGLQPYGWVAAGFPRSVPLIEGLLSLPAVALIRYSVRLSQRLRQRVRGQTDSRRVLVVGAGEAGIMIVKEMQRNPQLGLYPVLFVDDDPEKQRRRICGLPVRGDRHRIPALVKEEAIGMIVIAMPAAPGKVIREIVNLCKQTGIQAQVIPGMYELLGGRISINQLRSVQIEDLLRRLPVQTDTEQVGATIGGRRVLITGGGGSIGSELCRQVARYEPAELIVLGHGENSVFAIEGDLRREQALGALPPNVRIHPVIADIRDHPRLDQLFRHYRPEIIFHAAAHKHVPLMERNVADAVTNNVLGTRNLLELAEKHGVGRFVMISTDKAVNPTSIMGVTKRVAEQLVHAAALRSGRAFVAVRFGNVLGSRGSAVQVFKQQISHGGPVTVTHPEMKRYFMTIPEAVQLVLQAGALGRGGEVFALDMGEPVAIMDLARDLIRLSGLEEGRDIDIVFTGLRPGEKLFEELFADSEAYERTAHEKIFVYRKESTEAGGDGLPELHPQVDALIAAAFDGEEPAIRRILKRLVPEYQYESPAPGNGTEAERPLDEAALLLSRAGLPERATS